MPAVSQLTPAAEDELRAVAESISASGGAWQPTLDNLRAIVQRVNQADSTWRRTRQQSGIESARKRGVKLGRPAKDIPKNFDKVYLQWSSGEITAVKAAQKLGISRSLFYRWVDFWRAQEQQGA